MSVSKSYVAFIGEQLSALAKVTSRRMFGGVGLYADGLFFALIDDDTLYFKVDDSNRSDYVQRGSKPFCPFPDKSEFSMSYFDVPADLIDDAEELGRWARKSIAVALVAAARKQKKGNAVKRRAAKRVKVPVKRSAIKPTKKAPKSK